MNDLAGVPSDQGKYEAAEEMYQRALQLVVKMLSPEHRVTLANMDGLARVLSDQGKYETAEEMQQRALERMVKVLGPEHPTC